MTEIGAMVQAGVALGTFSLFGVCLLVWRTAVLLTRLSMRVEQLEKSSLLTFKGDLARS